MRQSTQITQNSNKKVAVANSTTDIPENIGYERGQCSCHVLHPAVV